MDNFKRASFSRQGKRINVGGIKCNCCSPWGKDEQLMRRNVRHTYNIETEIEPDIDDLPPPFWEETPLCIICGLPDAEGWINPKTGQMVCRECYVNPLTEWQKATEDKVFE